jgi:hypothetical protein
MTVQRFSISAFETRSLPVLTRSYPRRLPSMSLIPFAPFSFSGFRIRPQHLNASTSQLLLQRFRFPFSVFQFFPHSIVIY